MEKVGLVSIWDKFPVDYTHIHTDYKSTSVIDHFVMNERLVSLVADCGPIHLGDNRSRHSPIMVKLNMGAIPVKQKETSRTVKRPAWYKASQENISAFTKGVDDRLMSIMVPESIHCSDAECSDPTHSSERDSLVLDILLAIIEVSHSSIPMVGGKTVRSDRKDRSGIIPGWRETVEPCQTQARFWHSV